MPAATAAEAIYARLAAASGLTAVVGTRIAPQLSDQEPQFPLCVYTVAADGPRPVTLGTSGAPSPYSGEVTVYSPNDGEALAAAKAAGDALHCWRDPDQGVHCCFSAEPDGDTTEDGIRFYAVSFNLKFKPVG